MEVRTIDATDARISVRDLALEREHTFRVTALGDNDVVMKVSNLAKTRTPAQMPSGEPGIKTSTKPSN